MKILVLFAVLLSATSSFGQLAIYNFTGTQTIIGSGIEAKVRVTGVLIVDLANDRATRVAKFVVPGGKQFAIDEEPSFKAWRAQGATTTTALITTGQSETNNGTLNQEHTFYSGKESLVVIGPGTTAVSLPKSVKGAGYAIIDDGGPYVTGLGTISMVHSYSQKETVGANTTGETLEQAVERWRQTLIAQGYVEVDDD